MKKTPEQISKSVGEIIKNNFKDLPLPSEEEYQAMCFRICDVINKFYPKLSLDDLLDISKPTHLVLVTLTVTYVWATDDCKKLLGSKMKDYIKKICLV